MRPVWPLLPASGSALRRRLGPAPRVASGMAQQLRHGPAACLASASGDPPASGVGPRMGRESGMGPRMGRKRKPGMGLEQHLVVIPRIGT